MKVNNKEYRKKNKSRRKNKTFSSKTKKNKKFIKLNCSPENKDKKYTCYSDKQLIKLKNMWNARHRDAIITTNSPQEIWKQLKEYYSNVCNKESCWIKQTVNGTNMEKELYNAFAPKSPNEWKTNPNEWLSSVDILKVMKQYEKKYKCFEFLGPSPIDYDTHQLDGKCVWEELCNFNLANQIKNGKTKIGIVFNTDPHNKGGEHWISCFINIKKGTIFFFDSVGDKIPEQIMKFVNMVIEQGKKLPTPIDFKFDQNYPIEHQYGNTECGIYSIFFIVHLLEDKLTSHYLKTHILRDKYMEKFRKVYFNEDL
jgi:hypothetical protein